jgi:hypothetical protein
MRPHVYELLNRHTSAANLKFLSVLRQVRLQELQIQGRPGINKFLEFL